MMDTIQINRPNDHGTSPNRSKFVRTARSIRAAATHSIYHFDGQFVKMFSIIYWRRHCVWSRWHSSWHTIQFVRRWVASSRKSNATHENPFVQDVDSLQLPLLPLLGHRCCCCYCVLLDRFWLHPYWDRRQNLAVNDCRSVDDGADDGHGYFDSHDVLAAALCHDFVAFFLGCTAPRFQIPFVRLFILFVMSMCVVYRCICSFRFTLSLFCAIFAI